MSCSSSAAEHPVSGLPEIEEIGVIGGIVLLDGDFFVVFPCLFNELGGSLREGYGGVGRSSLSQIPSVGYMLCADFWASVSCIIAAMYNSSSSQFNARKRKARGRALRDAVANYNLEVDGVTKKFIL